MGSAEISTFDKHNGYYSASDDKAYDGKRKSSDASSISTVPEVDTRCGYFRCKPDCLQQCAKPRFVLTCMCIFGFAETYVQWGLINVNISTWERRYQLQSSQSAWIVAAQDLTQGVICPIFGYMGAYYHKGRMISSGTVLMAVASLLFVIPHFASGVYELSGAYKEDTCDSSSNVTLLDPCEAGLIDTNMDRWLAVFCFAQVIFGFVSCMIWTVGLPYIDDVFSSEDSVMAIGVFNMVTAIGSCCGFLLGGLFLELYVDIGRVDMDDVDIDSSDPRWVGAWWMGFFVSFFLALPLMFIMPCFPRELQAVAEKRKTKISEAHKGKGLGETDRHDFGKTCSDVGTSLKILFGNPVFITIIIGGTIELGGVTAFAAFLPKILQFQFGMTSGMAALVAGAVVVPGAALGQLLGGIIPKYGKLRFRGIFLMMIIGQAICILCSPSFLITCPMPSIAGYNVEYPFNSTIPENEDPFTHSCNVDCNCTTLEYAPVCSTQSVTYFNPCYAACASEGEEDGNSVYGNCSCLPNATSWDHQVENGVCSTTCPEFWIFVPFFLIIILCTFVENTGGYALVLRVCPEKQRSFALGVQNVFNRFLGTVPIPILFGYIFDQACDVWQDNCGEQGSCWIYDQEFLAWGMFIALILVKGLAGIAFTVGACIYKPPSEELVHDVISVHADSDTNSSHEEDFTEKVVWGNSTSANGYVVSKEGLENGGFQHSEDGNHGKIPNVFSDVDIIDSTRF